MQYIDMEDEEGASRSITKLLWHLMPIRPSTNCQNKPHTHTHLNDPSREGTCRLAARNQPSFPCNTNSTQVTAAEPPAAFCYYPFTPQSPLRPLRALTSRCSNEN